MLTQLFKAARIEGYPPLSYAGNFVHLGLLEAAKRLEELSIRQNLPPKHNLATRFLDVKLPDADFEALKTIEGIEPLPFTIVRRKAFPNAFSLGLSVAEASPADPKAVTELLSVVDALYTKEAVNGYHDATHRLIPTNGLRLLYPGQEAVAKRPPQLPRPSLQR